MRERLLTDDLTDLLYGHESEPSASGNILAGPNHVRLLREVDKVSAADHDDVHLEGWGLIWLIYINAHDETLWGNRGR
ncbi:hypothetical protein KXS07_35795 [Inquilinus limosus]|uniref:hypothetical protein n=1 Tax=Inquilinus limosus TaxID=171674 RepID=UPI003F17EF5C